MQGLVIIYGGLTIVGLLIEYFIKDTVTTEVSIQDFECKDYMFELIKTSLLSIFLHKKRDPVCAYTMNVIVEDKEKLIFSIWMNRFWKMCAKLQKNEEGRIHMKNTHTFLKLVI